MTDQAQAETRFTQSDGLSIAFQLWGQGPRNLILVPGMISHLEAALDRPGYLPFLQALGSMGRLAVFDKRGNGMSDRIQGAPTLDERVMDIEAVMQAADMSSATVIGLSEGASLACVYAAMRPERVERLVLCGGYARGRLTRGFTTEAGLLQEKDQFVHGWGQPGGAHPFSAFGPGPEDPAGQASRARFERMSATPTTVAALYDLAARIDIVDLLPTIRQPALVIHRDAEEPNGRDSARDFVARLPNVEYCPVPGHQHIPWEGDIETYTAPMFEFITGALPVTVPATRSLATILFSDLVNSTAAQAAMGDETWRDLMNRHDETCGACIARHRGSLVKFTGDGFLATFESPTSALDCAEAVRTALAALGLPVRFGAHTGEIESRGSDISGLGVVIAARIMDHAGAGEVLASDLTRQLMLGAPHRFEPRGEHALKGVPERWRLHAVLPD